MGKRGPEPRTPQDLTQPFLASWNDLEQIELVCKKLNVDYEGYLRLPAEIVALVVAKAQAESG